MTDGQEAARMWRELERQDEVVWAAIKEEKRPHAAIPEMEVWEAYEMGCQDTEAKDLRVLRAFTVAALFFGFVCGLLGWAIGRWL